MGYENKMNKVFFGDCRDVMRDLIKEGVKVQMCVTSPPYWGLRDYGVAGQLGLEPTPEEYVANMVDVFRLVRELLADDGTLWLNLGDSYSGSGKGGNPDEGKQATNKGSQSIGVLYGKTGETARECALTNVSRRWTTEQGIPPKNLIGIPWRVAFALQADGWYLRSDIIWHKPNPMPESVIDRPTRSHEYIFLLSKSERYYYDSKAIREKAVTMENDTSHHSFGTPGGKTEQTPGKLRKESGKKWNPKMGGGGTSFNGHSGNYKANGEPICGVMRNKRDVWTVATQPFSGAHFATFPEALIEPCVLAGSRLGDIVLDPFFGSGTTGQVAEKLGRKWIGIELNRDYEPLQKQRTAQTGLAL